MQIAEKEKKSMADTELILKIINAVKQRDCLWNVHSAEYAKRDKLEKAWQEVADDVGRPEVFCREKWRNVRTGFLRSIQHNTARPENNDSTEDLPTPRRKRFYLYDDIKFILTSTEASAQTKKRRMLSRNVKTRISNDETSADYGGGGDNANHETTANTILTFAASEDAIDTRHYNAHTDNNNHQHGATEQGAISSKYTELLNELQNATNNFTSKMTTRKSVAAATAASASAAPRSMKMMDEEITIEPPPNSHSTPLVGGVPIAPKCENNATVAGNESSFNLNATARGMECGDDRDEQQLLAFFRSNLDDILSLPRYKQRLFKRRMLEMIDDLHGSDEGMGGRRNHYS